MTSHHSFTSYQKGYALGGIVLFLMLWSFSSARAQSIHRTGLMPSVNLRAKLSDQYSLNFNTQSRFATGSGEDVRVTSPDDQLVDLTTVLVRSVGLNSKLAGGYVLRLREDRTAHRFMQQYVYVRRYGRYRLGHRLRADQT